MIDLQHPRDSTFCLGHARAEASFYRAIESSKLPHAWLLRGRSGIGKATLAYRLARRLLVETPEKDACQTSDHPIFRMVASGAHPDLHVLERQINPRTGNLQKEIVVDAVRGAAEALRNTSARGRRRILIVDAVDDLNNNAANALLKLLEEPPAEIVLLLICHRPAGVPRTLLSRCMELRLGPLSSAHTDAVLERIMPALPLEDRKHLRQLVEGSPGTLLSWHQRGFLRTYEQVTRQLLVDGENRPSLLGPVDLMAALIKDHGFDAALEPLSVLVRRIALVRSHPASVNDAFAGERDILAGIGQAGSLDQWAGMWEKLRTLSRQVELLNLDARQAILLALSAIRGDKSALRAW